MPKIIFTVVKDASDWQTLINGRDNARWFYDADCREAVPAEVADAYGDDIYTQWGWNQEPQNYPVLAHIEGN